MSDTLNQLDMSMFGLEKRKMQSKTVILVSNVQIVKDECEIKTQCVMKRSNVASADE